MGNKRDHFKSEIDNSPIIGFVIGLRNQNYFPNPDWVFFLDLQTLTIKMGNGIFPISDPIMGHHLMAEFYQQNLSKKDLNTIGALLNPHPQLTVKGDVDIVTIRGAKYQLPSAPDSIEVAMELYQMEHNFNIYDVIIGLNPPFELYYVNDFYELRGELNVTSLALDSNEGINYPNENPYDYYPLKRLF